MSVHSPQITVKTMGPFALTMVYVNVEDVNVTHRIQEFSVNNVQTVQKVSVTVTVRVPCVN